MKRFLTLSIAVVALLTLSVACTKGGGDKGGSAEAPKAKPIGPVEYWKDWEKGVVGQFPNCGTNVLQLGLDQILQDTVDTYCALDPGHYKSLINPAVKDIYDNKGTDYPDGRTAILLLPKLGVAFTTDHKDGKPIFNAILMADSTPINSAEEGHPLNPKTCANCHYGYDGLCENRGFTCGNRSLIE
ncbi:MAG: hypothetical protein OEY64_01380 [Nitrospinota bacterium]|nr:hypothetical protein [Nitrospinota bacterium]